MKLREIYPDKEKDSKHFPKDWLSFTLGDLLTFKNGLNKESKYFGYGTPIINYMDVFNNNSLFNKDIEGKVFLNSQEKKNFSAKNGDVFFTRTSETQEEIGSAAVLLEDIEDCVFSGFVLRGRPYTNLVDKHYFQYCLTPEYVRSQIFSMSSYTTRALTNGTSLAKVNLVVPPTHNEQKAIAQVLSDTNSLIQALEKKIAKKKLIKKGVMQKLLTPKEDWIESKVVSIGQPYGGLSGKTKADFSNGNAHYVPFMNVMNNPIADTGYLDLVNINKGESQNKILKGDLLFNGSSETPEELGFCSAVLEQIDNLYLNSFCFGFRILNTKQYDSLFLAYFFRSSLGREFFYSLAQGATRYNLSKTNFLKSTLLLPTYEDQVQIASIVKDIDYEIENLEQKLFKYQLAKQGMMQQLLTGKKRLV